MIGFWHPFGPHGGEKPECIIERKYKEIKDNGWTFWSFQHRTDETLNQWINQIKKNKGPIFVFCSYGVNAREPRGKKFYARQFKYPRSNTWNNIPSTIGIPHPFGRQNSACAFKIVAIREPGVIKIPKGFKWFCVGEGIWKEDRLPTRGEYLLKSGGRCMLRKIYLILELIPPYLAVIKK